MADGAVEDVAERSRRKLEDRKAYWRTREAEREAEKEEAEANGAEEKVNFAMKHARESIRLELAKLAYEDFVIAEQAVAAALEELLCDAEAMSPRSGRQSNTQRMILDQAWSSVVGGQRATTFDVEQQCTDRQFLVDNRQGYVQHSACAETR